MAEQNPFKKHWAGFSQTSIWIASVIGTFLIAPPRVSLEDAADGTVAFLRFAVAILVGIVFVISAVRYKARRHHAVWLGSAALALVVVIASFFGYQHFKHQWTCAYASKYELVIGQTLTEDARAFVDREKPGTYSCADLLAEYGGRSDKIWVWSEIVNRHTLLVLAFSLVWLSAAFSLMSVVQAARCASRK